MKKTSSRIAQSTFVWLLALTLLPADRSQAQAPPQEAAATGSEAQGSAAALPDIVHLTPEQITASDIEIAAAGPGPVDSGSQLVGEVHPNGDRLAHITPRFPGIVREVLKKVGDEVKAGESLLRIYFNDSAKMEDVKARLLRAYRFGAQPPAARPLIVERIT